jgi:hypothetical protein
MRVRIAPCDAPSPRPRRCIGLATGGGFGRGCQSLGCGSPETALVALC